MSKRPIVVDSQGILIKMPANNSYKGMACLTGRTTGFKNPNTHITIAIRGKKSNAEALLDLKNLINIISVAKFSLKNY